MLGHTFANGRREFAADLRQRLVDAPWVRLTTTAVLPAPGRAIARPMPAVNRSLLHVVTRSIFAGFL